MNIDPMDRSFTWYQELFCRELCLCVESDQDWGSANYDAERIVEIGQYYIDHPEFSRVGREMILESTCESASERMRSGQLSIEAENVLYKVVQKAIADIYDRDVIALYWRVPDQPKDPNPLHRWLRDRFPDWTPPPSVWSE